MRYGFLNIAVLALLTFSHSAGAADKAPLFNDPQRIEIQNIVRDYLVRSPQVLVEASQALQAQQANEESKKTSEGIAKNRDKVYKNPNSPVIGNPKGDVTIVEFFDYSCSYCQMAHNFLNQVMKDDKNVRVILKDYPILGASSELAAKAALAAVRQNKYEALHNEFLKSKGHLSEEMVRDAIKRSGVDVKKLEKDMADPAIAKILKDNIELGNDLGVRGTPMFIVGNKSFAGVLQVEQMKKAIADARSEAKKGK